MYLKLLVLLLCLNHIVEAIPIDNGVDGDPEIECTAEQFAVIFKTQKPFAGRIFVKGHASEPDCTYTATGGTDQPPPFEVIFAQCGVERSRQASPPGVVMATTVVISFHHTFITKVDRAYRVACYYMEASKTVSADLDVSMLTTDAITATPEMPICRYEILTGGPTGQQTRYARVGDQVYHKWTCDSKDNVYCMRVHSCVADDGQSSESFMVLNEQGCATDRYVLQNLEYATDLMAGQLANVVKFADKAIMYFSCQIELLSKATDASNCAFARPNCTNTGETAAAVSASTDTFVRRRLVRSHLTTNDTKKEQFRVVTDLNMPAQELLILDLEDAPTDSRRTSSSALLASSPPSVATEGLVGSSWTSSAPTIIEHSKERVAAVCLTPLELSVAAATLTAVIIIGLSAAVRAILQKAWREYYKTMANRHSPRASPQPDQWAFRRF